jgi:alpha-glucosidase
MRNITLAVFMLLSCSVIAAPKTYQVKSPDGHLNITVSVGKSITYSLSQDGAILLSPSDIALKIKDMQGFGIDSKVKSAKVSSHSSTITASAYKKSKVDDTYNELTLQFKNHFNLLFRAYNEGMAYRFQSDMTSNFIVENEVANFNFPADWQAVVPYVREKELPIEKQLHTSFENVYSNITLSQFDPDRLAFLPLIVKSDKGVNLCITEADLEHYPGMFLRNTDKSPKLFGYFAACPKAAQQGETSRENFIARCAAKTNFPWRVISVANHDSQLLDNDMVYKLASPSRLSDSSWVKPGMVSWDWWNDWGLYNVDFKAGINTATYKKYIDFAAKNKIPYILMDEGWSVPRQSDLMKIIPEIDMKEIVSYASSKGVGVILWAGSYDFKENMDNVCKYFSEMGVKGFKVDFMDSDDQDMVDFHYRAAKTAAKYKLMMDFHGTYKPTGLNRTYPNVVGFEGVHGLEQMKWATLKDADEVVYDVTMPYMRMLAGPVDYTQGAMHNATRNDFYPSHSNPMSQGTRCHQLAEYVAFYTPFNMLCDSPTHYEEQQQCTDFITTIPTVWNETKALDGKIGEYVVIARRNGNTWYVGALNNWTARTLQIDLSFLGTGNFKAQVFQDGPNANKVAVDYSTSTVSIPASRKMDIPMASGGGYVMKITRE